MSRVLIEMIERHADEVAFLWEQRERGCRSPLFDLAALVDLDRRLQANLDGLVIARDVGLEKCAEALARGTASELFAAVYVSAELGDTMALARFLMASERYPGGGRVVVSALASLSQSCTDRVLSEFLADECPPALQCLGLAGYAARRQDPGRSLERALSSPYAPLRARAFRAAGQLGRRDLLPVLRAEARAGAGDTEPWAAWSAVLLGDTSTLPILWDAAERGGQMAIVGCDLAVRCVASDEAAARLEKLARSPHSVSAALAGAAARGDPACIPWVLELMEHAPELSRRAAWAYATITGVRLEPPLAVRVPTEEPPEHLVISTAGDPYDDLPAPDGAALRSHWRQVGDAFVPGQRRLGGRLLKPSWLVECLLTGAQPWRASSAMELARTLQRGDLFPVHALAPVQASRLASSAGARRPYGLSP